MSNLLTIRLTLKGRPVQSYTFDKPAIVIGRDPECDICIDNTGISRKHARIAKTEVGYLLEDLGSSNGTFLNDQPARRNFLQHDDLIQIGKFALWIGLESDRRERPLSANSATPDSFEGTMVLSSEQMMKLQKKAREGDSFVVPRPRKNRLAKAMTGLHLGSAVLAAFLLGFLIGVAMTSILKA